MPRARHEYIAHPEGIVNRKMLQNNPPGEVITYRLSEQERLALIEKYGPPLRPLKRHRPVIYPKF